MISNEGDNFYLLMRKEVKEQSRFEVPRYQEVGYVSALIDVSKSYRCVQVLFAVFVLFALSYFPFFVHLPTFAPFLFGAYYKCTS